MQVLRIFLGCDYICFRYPYLISELNLIYFFKVPTDKVAHYSVDVDV